MPTLSSHQKQPQHWQQCKAVNVHTKRWQKSRASFQLGHIHVF